ncbi:MAG TPA: translocation/assembly module TamB domain-containing protein [Candidatus Acidoferrales bacterium]|nr:translocation/assembly module TamB domain-containing protein [Candidatus Acidoferrales bacterium]
MRGRIGRLLLWLGSALGLLLAAALAGAWLYTQTDQFRSLLRARLLAALDDALNAEVTVGEIAGSIWGRLEFRDVAIAQKNAPVLSAPRLAIRLGILGQVIPVLTASAVHVKEIEIAQPKLWLAQDEDGNWNVLDLVKPRQSQEPGRFSIYLDRIRINNATIEVAAAGGKQARISSLSASADAALLPAAAELDVEYLNFALAAPGLPGVSWASEFSFKQSGNTARVDIEKLELATNASRVKATGTIHDLKDPELALTVELKRGSAEEITRMVPSLPLGQDISGVVRVSGPVSKLSVSGSVKAPGGEITTAMLADVTAPKVEGTLELKQFALGEVLTVPGFRGRANGRVSFSASSLDDAQASAQAALAQVAVNGWELGQVNFSGRLKNRSASFTAQAAGTPGTAELNGKAAFLGTPRYELTLSARRLDLKKAAGDKAPLAATLNLDASVNGRGTELKTIELDTRITLLPSEISGIRIQQGRVEAAIRRGTLALREARFVARGATLNAKGKIASLEKDATGNIAYSLALKEIGPWAKLAQVEGSGSAKIEGTIGGSLQSLRLEGKASLTELSVAKNYLQSGNIRWTLGSAGGEWRGRISADAKNVKAGIPLNSVQTQLVIEASDPATIGAEITARDSEQRVHKFKTRVVRKGKRAEIVLQEIALELANGTWRNPRPALLAVEGTSVTIEDLLLQQGAQRIAAKGRTGMEGAQDLSLEVTRFPLEDVGAFTDAAPELGGLLSLTLRVRGTALQPVIESGIRIESLRVAGQRYAGLAGQASYQKERLSVDVRLMQDKTHELTARGILPVYLGWGGSKTPATTGEADLRIYSAGLSPAFLAAFTKDVDSLQGILSVDVRIRGPLNALAPSGAVQFQDGAARVMPLGLSLREIGLRARITPSAIEIVELRARSGEGRITGTGRLGVKQYAVTGIGLSLNAEQFSVINTREYKATASGRLVAAGTLKQPEIRGALSVKGTLRPDLALLKKTGQAAQDRTIVVVQSEAELAKSEKNAARKDGNGAGKTEEEPSFLRQLALDVTAEISRGTWVYIDEGSMEVTGRLRVRKQANENIVLTGNLQGLHGWYSFQGKRFRIEKAEATFTGGSEIDPALDIVARYRVPQYQVYVVIGGNMTKPTLTLRSEPQLEQADILAVLLFGRPVNALSQGEQNALQKQALKATADYFASGLTQSVARRLGVDTLQYGVGENLGQGQLEVGKYVREDVFVSATQQFGGEKQQEYSVEYEIAPNWQIKSSTTSDGKSGIDLFWKKQY